MAWRPVDPALGHPLDWPRALRLAVVGGLVGAGLVLLTILVTPSPGGNRGTPYARIYAHPTNGFEVALDEADGQAYAALGRDPLLRHPEYFANDGGAAAPFLGRPLLPHLLWALSLGQPGLMPEAFVLAEGLAGFLLVLGGAVLLQASGRPQRARLAVIAVLLPSTVIGFILLGQDVLALGLALVGIVLWCRPQPRWVVAVAVLTGAGLTRETMLVLVAVLALYGIAARGPRRRDLALAVPFVAYEGWSLWAEHRYPQRFGRDVSHGVGLPFVGAVRAVAGWGWDGRCVLALTVALVVVALLRPAHSLTAWLLAGFVAASAIAAEGVWSTWTSGIRVSGPAAVLALLAVRLPGDAVSEGRPVAPGRTAVDSSSGVSRPTSGQDP